MDKVKKKRSGLLTMNAYAKRRGVSHTAVAKAVRTGRISRTAEGLIDPEVADREWEENTNPAKAFSSVVNNSGHRRSTDSPPMPFAGSEEATSPANGLPPIAQSRAIREAYEARIRKLDYEVRKGKLVNADEVRVAAFNVARITRDRLMVMPDRLASLVVGLNDAHKIHKLLNAEIHLVCEELSKPDTYSNIEKVSEK
ncbi:MAG: hypothetical protein Q8P12_06235 [bacterium]|nr:hypothetical protein [bacterium]